ncbi:hypothetical protein EFS30_06265 [Levilactobacillus parabrevis]|nr:hypothetical protein [Levilactobacillus parabrevis]MCT4490210.1 hypothetical protein [Levilactobacillus parabrevis]
MVPTQIYIARIPFDDNSQSKIRPALIIENTDLYATVFKITSKFQAKSVRIQNFYYPIKKWKEAGLVKPSFIDIHRTYDITLKLLLRHTPIGKLTLIDQRDLLTFIQTHGNSVK